MTIHQRRKLFTLAALFAALAAANLPSPAAAEYDADQSALSVAQATTPVAEQPNPVAEQPNPAVEKPSPAVEKPILPVEKPARVAKKPVAVRHTSRPRESKEVYRVAQRYESERQANYLFSRVFLFLGVGF